MLLIDALYINKGGGKVLLENIIDYVVEKKKLNHVFFLFDDRLKSDNTKKLSVKQIKYLKSGEKNRFFFYKKYENEFSSFICFANIPPPICIKDKSVIVYFHNVLLLDSSKSNLKLGSKLLFSIKKIYIRFLNNSNYKWAVQTLNVSNLLHSKLGIEKSKILVCPIFNIDFFKNCNSGNEENNVNYLYVADDSLQKNHVILLQAWLLFLKNNRNITLHLTLNKTSFDQIINKIQLEGYDQLNVINHGWCPLDKIRDLYMKCNYLVYPSLAESFGLPLIEAAAAGCKIIASDLPYVHEVVNPSLVFNPDNVESILMSLNASMDYINIPSTDLKVENKIDLLLNTNSYV
jgi:glycosyltransferase involved in cell wall biosynthesis